MKERIAEALWKINHREVSDRVAELLEEAFMATEDGSIEWTKKLEEIVAQSY